MALALAASALVAVALLSDMLLPLVTDAWRRQRQRRRVAPELSIDPGRDRRAERTARELLRSCVNEEEWAMYCELGFIRVWGSGPPGEPEYAYLIYPHRPIIAYAVQTGRVLGEHCVVFPDQTRPFGTSRLPDSDDVLAKWMALTSDEQRLLRDANTHLPGRQMSLVALKRDIWRLSRWERERAGDRGGSDPASGAPSAPAERDI